MNESPQDPIELEGYDELLRKLLDSLPLEERLLALPDEALRAFSDDYLRTLSPETQAILRTRIGRPA